MEEDKYFQKLFLRIKVYFPTHYAITKRIISIAIPKLEYFYSKVIKTSIIKKCPTKINRKSSYEESSIFKSMRTRLIYNIFIKIRNTHLLELLESILEVFPYFDITVCFYNLDYRKGYAIHPNKL